MLNRSLPAILLPFVGLASLSFLGGCDNAPTGELEKPDYIIGEEAGVSEASPENPQVVRGTTFEDYHLAFTIDRPNDSWEFLTSERAATISPDASMAMLSPSDSSYVAVVVETMADVTLKEYSDIIFDPTGILGNPEASELERTTIGGLPAVTKTIPTLVGGAPFIYRVAIIQNGDFFYQVLGWGLESKFREKGLASVNQIINSFRPAEGRTPELKAYLVTKDSYGPAWRIQDRVYQHAVAGLRLRAPEGTRLMNDIELFNTSPESDLGIADGYGQFYQTWIIENIGGDKDLADELPMVTAEAWGKPGEATPAQVAGITGQTIEIFADDSKTGFEGSITAILKGPYLVQFVSWWLPEGQAAADTLRPEIFNNIEAMDDSEITEVREALAELDPNNAVGIDFSCRHNVFSDYLYQFKLTVPDLCHLQTSATAITDPTNRLEFTSPSGSYFEVSGVSIEGGETEHAEVHGEYSSSDPAPTSRKIGSTTFLVSPYETIQDGGTVNHVHASTIKGKNVFQIWATSVFADHATLENELTEILKNFERPENLRKWKIEKDRIVDHRIGYEIITAPEWSSKNISLGDASALGSFYMMTTSDKKLEVGALGMCSPAGLQMDLATDAMLGSLGIKITPGTETTSADSLAGVDAKKRQVAGQLRGKAVTVTVWTASKANSGYCLFTLDRDNLSDAELKTLSRRFKLLR